MEKAKPTVLMVRHGDTDANSSDNPNKEVFRGHWDVPLNADGLEQARRVAENLKERKINYVATTNLKRGSQLAALIGQTHPDKPPVQQTEKLRPWHLGHLTRKSVKEHLDEMLEYIRVKPHERIPGGESFDEYVGRSLPEFQRHFLEARRHPERGAVVVVGHTRTQRLADGWHKAGMGRAVDLEPLLQEKHLSPGESMEFTHDGQRWNKRLVPNEAMPMMESA